MIWKRLSSRKILFNKPKIIFLDIVKALQMHTITFTRVILMKR